MRGGGAVEIAVIGSRPRVVPVPAVGDLDIASAPRQPRRCPSRAANP